MDLTNLILTGDYFIFFAYAILAFYFFKFVLFRKADKSFKRVMGFFLIFKIACSLLLCLLQVYYWKVSDNFGFFTETKNFVKLISTDLSNIKYFFLSVDSYNDKIKFDNSLTAAYNSIGVESNFLVTKFSTLFYPFAFGRYMIVTLFFALISAAAQLKFYALLVNRYPQIKRGIAIGVLFMPSVVIYSSYITKETLCITFMSIGIFNLFQLINKKKVVANFFLLSLNLLLIGIVKLYVLGIIALALLMVIFVKWTLHFWRGSVLSKIFIAVFLAGFMWLFLSNLDFFDPYILDFATVSNTFQEGYNAADETSAFELGELETSFAGLLKKAPLGLYTTYFRPHLWEVTKPIILFSALESFFVLILTFWAIFSRWKHIGHLMRTDLFVNFSVWFVILFGTIVGLTTFNFGTLIRYKIPAVPFLMVFVFLLLNSRSKKTIPLPGN